MFFLTSFTWLVAASFAFVLAMLTPNWLSFQKQNSTGNITERGIFYVCDLLSNTTGYKTTRCLSILEQNSSNNSNTWIYGMLSFLFPI